MRDAQNKMSKRHGDPSYEDLKAQGYLTEAILNYVALLGWSPKGELAEQEIFTLEELVKAFDIDRHLQVPRHFRPGRSWTTSTPSYLRSHGAGGLRQGGGALHPPDA